MMEPPECRADLLLPEAVPEVVGDRERVGHLAAA
jgi:hypothetical protein